MVTLFDRLREVDACRGARTTMKWRQRWRTDTGLEGRAGDRVCQNMANTPACVVVFFLLEANFVAFYNKTSEIITLNYKTCYTLFSSSSAFAPNSKMWFDSPVIAQHYVKKLAYLGDSATLYM